MLFLALRHLLARKRQTFLMLVGILLGTAAYVVISGMMMGFQTFIIDQLVNNDSHIRISACEELIEEHSLDREFYGDALVSWVSPPSGRRDNAYLLYPQGWFERLQRDPRVKAFSPQIQTQVIATRGRASLGARLVGTEPERQSQVTTISKYMLRGSFEEIGTSGNRIIVGEGVLKKLGAAMNETLLLSSGKGAPQPFKIVGVFNLGIKSLDESMIFGALSDVQKLNQTPSRLTDIAVRLVDLDLVDEAADSWAMISEDKVQSWSQANEGTLSVFKTQDIVRNSMTISILVVAGFGIYNILSMAVAHKRREIAILRSMGFDPGDILRLFLIQGLVLGALGGILGSIIGYIASLYLSTIEVSSQRMLGGGTMMISFAPSIYVKGFLLAFLSSAGASLLPARSAGRLQPIEIIRTESS